MGEQQKQEALPATEGIARKDAASVSGEPAMVGAPKEKPVSLKAGQQRKTWTDELTDWKMRTIWAMLSGG